MSENFNEDLKNHINKNIFIIFNIFIILVIGVIFFENFHNIKTIISFFALMTILYTLVLISYLKFGFIMLGCRDEDSKKLIKIDKILKNNYPRLPDDIRKEYVKKIYEIL